MAKIRTSIPSDLAADVLFASDSTCCVCNVRGKSLQIHHIDENPNNNAFENLSVLCLECHNGTQIKGGFGRKLNDNLVIKYRNDWLERVTQRRNLADEMAIKQQVGEISLSQQIEKQTKPNTQHGQLREPSINYINSLPEFKAALLKQAQPNLDIGNTVTVAQTSYDYIDSLTGILVTLANYYSPDQFKDQTPHGYFSEIISSRFQWHRTVVEPYGPGTGGTIVKFNIAGSVRADVETMVEDIVVGLVGYNESFDLDNWSQRWRGVATVA